LEGEQRTGRVGLRVNQGILLKEELYGLVNQIRRCAVSILSKIAEDCGRNTSKDSLQFFFIARGSLYELETQLYLSFDFAYVNKEKLDESPERITRSKRLLNGFINYYQKTS
jgi:four helix bundle protein